MAPENDPHVSAPVPIDGATLQASIDFELKELFGDSPLHCRYCGNEVHADSYQVVAFNGGVLYTPPWDQPGADAVPHIYCGCGDFCLARDLAHGLKHLEDLEVEPFDGSRRVQPADTN